MQEPSKSISFEDKSPLYFLDRPRLWSLLSGGFALALGFYLLRSIPVDNFWETKLVGEPHFFGLILILLGAFLVAKARLSEFLSIHIATFDSDGIALAWSYVPSISSARVSKGRKFNWLDLNSIAWLDVESYPSVRQQIKLEFKEPLGVRRSHIKIKICNDRNYERCKSLAVLLPKNISVPHWFEQIRDGKAPSDSQLDGTPMH